MFHDNVRKEVEPFLLDGLIASNKIKGFMRSTGWVNIGADPVRAPGGRRRGPDRRLFYGGEGAAVQGAFQAVARPVSARGRAIDPAMEPDYKKLLESAPGLFLVFDEDLRIVAASEEYLRASGTSRHDIMGRKAQVLFGNGREKEPGSIMKVLSASLERVRKTRMSDVMVVRKYDIRINRSAGSPVEERYWSPVNIPVMGHENEVRYIIHRVEDVTEIIQQRQRMLEQDRAIADFADRVARLEAELDLKTREVEETLGYLGDALAKVDACGVISMCAHCKRVKNEDGTWEDVEHYLAARIEAKFTHGICPECEQRLYPELMTDDPIERLR